MRKFLVIFNSDMESFMKNLDDVFEFFSKKLHVYWNNFL